MVESQVPLELYKSCSNKNCTCGESCKCEVDKAGSCCSDKKCSNKNCTCVDCKCGSNCGCEAGKASSCGTKCSNKNCTCTDCKCGPNCGCEAGKASSCGTEKSSTKKKLVIAGAVIALIAAGAFVFFKKRD